LNAHRTSVYLLVVTVIGLIVLGLVMLSSTSAYAPESHGSALFLLKRQLMWLGIGALVCAIAAGLDYHLLQKTWWIWFLLSVFLLSLCFVPHICHRINGSRRWINIGVTFQPSEFAKLAAIATVAWWFARPSRQLPSTAAASPGSSRENAFCWNFWKVNKSAVCLFGASILVDKTQPVNESGVDA